jgi:DNA-binding transcriptional MerR regulator
VVGNRFTIREVAQRIGCHPLTLKRLEASGKIPIASRDFHGWRVYTEKDVQAIDRIVNSLTEPTEKVS